MSLSPRFQNYLVLLIIILAVPAIQYTLNWGVILESPPRYNPDDLVATFANFYTATPSYNQEVLAMKIHNEVNLMRESNGVRPLEYNRTLANQSERHSYSMVQGYGMDRMIFHSSDGTPENILLGHVVNTGKWSFSTLICTYLTDDELAKEIVHQWMSSPLHAKNIIDNFEGEGIGVVQKRYRIFATQQFDYSPAASSISPPIMFKFETYGSTNTTEAFRAIREFGNKTEVTPTGRATEGIDYYYTLDYDRISNESCLICNFGNYQSGDQPLERSGTCC